MHAHYERWLNICYFLEKHKNTQKQQKNRNNLKTLLSKFQGVYLTDSFNIAPQLHTVITEEKRLKKYNYHRRQPKTDSKDQNPDLDYVQKR